MRGRRRDRTATAHGVTSTALAAPALVLADDGAAEPTLTAELALTRAGRRVIAGVDEVGRGALAGPLVAAAVVLPPVADDAAVAELGATLAGVRDSKRLTPAGRERLAARVRELALAVELAIVPEAVIDALGIGAANRLALRQALAALPLAADHALIDAVLVPGLTCDQTALIRGDARCLSIAAASIVAKVTRDALMDSQATRYPAYGFERHKGYGTAEHLAALARHGPSPIHRRSFAPVRTLVAGLLPAAAGA
jgi:ribonuclease HII